MNQLEYTLLVNDIKHNCTVSKLEGHIRVHLALCHDMKWSTTLPELIKFKFDYKVLTLALNTFATKSKRTLRDFIYSNYSQISKSISKILPQLSYTDMMDVLEFHTEFTVGRNNNLTTLYHSVIEDKPLHFNLDMNTYNSSFDTYSLTTNSISKLTRCFRNKLVLAPNQPSTVLDQELALTKSAYTIPSDTTKILQQIDESRIRLEQQLLALEQCKQYIITQGK